MVAYWGVATMVGDCAWGCTLNPNNVPAPPADQTTIPAPPTGSVKFPAGQTVSGSPQVFIAISPPVEGEKKDDNTLGVEAIRAAGQIISAAAWPIAIVLVAWLLRKEIAKFLARLKKLKWGEFEASVEEEIENLGTPPQQEPTDGTDPLGFAVNDLSRRAPIDAIVTAWVAVERAVERYLEIAAPSTSSSISQSQRRNAFSRHALSLLPDDLRGIFSELKHIRNRVVHEADADLSPDAVRLYVEQAAWVSRRLSEQAGVTPAPS